MLVVLIVAAGAWFWHLLRQPLYEPGVVREATTLRAPLDPPSPGSDPTRWRVEEDVELHHFAVGEGPPVLVLHGGPGMPISAPLPALASLTAARRFHYFDQRGCGGSTRPLDRFASRNYMAKVKELDGAVGLAAQVADIERIRRILGEEKLTILGHSFGGFLGALYAAEFPARVERMVLVAPAGLLVFPAEHGDLFSVIGERLSPARRAEYDAFLEEYLDFGSLFDHDEETLRSRNAAIGNWYAEAIAPATLPPGAATDPAAIGGWCVQGAYFSMGFQHDYAEALTAVHAPTLVLHGSADLSPLAGSQSYVDALPDARLEIVDGADHFLLFDESEAVSGLMGGFLGVTANR